MTSVPGLPVMPVPPSERAFHKLHNATATPYLIAPHTAKQRSVQFTEEQAGNEMRLGQFKGNTVADIWNQHKNEILCFV